jgi:hypothetical protein
MNGYVNWVVLLGWLIASAICLAGWVLLFWALGSLAA